MPRDARAFLWDVRSAADKIATFVRGKTVDEFTGDELLYSAVERQLEIIGEALNQLTKAAPELAGRIEDLHKIVGLCNILIHGYAIVKRDLIWRAVQENLPRLRDIAERLLESSETSPR